MDTRLNETQGIFDAYSLGNYDGDDDAYEDYPDDDDFVVSDEDYPEEVGFFDEYGTCYHKAIRDNRRYKTAIAKRKLLEIEKLDFKRTYD